MGHGVCLAHKPRAVLGRVPGVLSPEDQGTGCRGRAAWFHASGQVRPLRQQVPVGEWEAGDPVAPEGLGDGGQRAGVPFCVDVPLAGAGRGLAGGAGGVGAVLARCFAVRWFVDPPSIRDA